MTDHHEPTHHAHAAYRAHEHRARETPRAHDARDDAAGARGLGTRAHCRDLLARVRTAVHASRGLKAGPDDVRALADAPAVAAARALPALRAQLRGAVTAYVRRLHADGLPPERMLVEVKGAVRDGAPPELDVVAARELMDDVVRWSVEAYYHVG